MSKKLLILLLFILGISVFFWISFEFISKQVMPKQEVLTTEQTPYPSDEIKVITHYEDVADHKVNIEYPQLMIKQRDPLVVDSINMDIKKIVDDEFNTFKLGYGEYNSATGEFVSLSDSSLEGQDSFYASFAVASLTDKFYSLEINTQTSFVNETVHPAHYIFTYNYDFVRNKQLKITDLLVSPNGLDKISSITLSKLDNNFREKWQESEITDWTKQGASPDVANYKNFLIKKDGIEILFDEYQIASYADGQPRVFLPFKEIKFLLSPEYVFLAE